MNTKNRLVWPLMATGVLLCAFAFSAGSHAKDRLFDELELSEAQRQSLKSLRAEFEPLRETAQAQRKEVRALAKAGDVDSAADLAADQAREGVYHRAEMHRRMAEILTAEQLVQHEAMRSSRAESSFEGRVDKRRHKHE